MSTSEILYPVAKLKDGQWVHIGNAYSGVEVYCPECQGRMVAKLGDIKQHHFSHIDPSPSCTGESAVHSLAKQTLAYTLELVGEIRFSTACRRWLHSFCAESHCRTILHKLPIRAVKLEHGSDGFIPDITVILADKARILCEVIYKNPISQEKWTYFSSLNIPVIVWYVKDVNEAMSVPMMKGYQIPHGKRDEGLAIYTERNYHKTAKCPGIETIEQHKGSLSFCFRT